MLSSSFAAGNIPLVSALFLGLLAAIGPCTLATNIAAIAYISRRVTDVRYAAVTGMLYNLGRMFTYSTLGILIIAIGLETPMIANSLQLFGERALGPFLIAMGIVLLVIDRFSMSTGVTVFRPWEAGLLIGG